MSVFESLMFAVAFATLIVLILSFRNKKQPILELRAQMSYYYLEQPTPFVGTCY